MPYNNEMFHQKLRQKMDEYVHFVYALTKKFPHEELYGVTSQLRRAALSVILNYVEGFARNRDTVYRNFLEMSYGSLQESRYLLEFSKKENYMTEGDFQTSMKLADEIGAMLWTTIEGIKNTSHAKPVS
ncbi:MAG: four helix bundle protein [Patescibacteria group bacterium]